MHGPPICYVNTQLSKRDSSVCRFYKGFCAHKEHSLIFIAACCNNLQEVNEKHRKQIRNWSSSTNYNLEGFYKDYDAFVGFLLI